MKKTSTQHVTAKKIMAASQKITGILLLMLLSAGVTHAQIPGTITGTYTVSSPESSAGDCVIAPGGKLIVTNGATATFNGDIIIHESGEVEFINNSTVKMIPDGKILIKGYSATTGIYSIGGSLIANNASITTAVPGQFWKGIEAARASIPDLLPHPASTCILTNTTLSYAQSAIANFDPSMGTILASIRDSKIQANNVLFLNNLMYSLQLASAANVTSGYNTFLRFTQCTFTYSLDFPYNPGQMMWLSLCQSVPFLNCTFKGKPTESSQTAYTTAILGAGSSVRVEPDVTGNPGGFFEDLKYGIYLTGSLSTGTRSVIRNATFYCQYAVALRGAVNPFIADNSSFGPLPGVNNDYCSFYLDNCPTYDLMSNTVQYDIGPSNSGFRGIVIRNGGVGNTEVLGNTVMATNIDLQSLGTNRSIDELTGLKFLCNDLEYRQVDEYNITVMKDIAPNSNNGIHRQQYITPYLFVQERAAGNRFATYYPPNTTPYNYFLEPGTNNLQLFTYKFSNTDPAEDPVYSNIVNKSTTNYNNCIWVVENPIARPFSFYYYTERLRTIEQGINGIENRINRNAKDTITLGALYTQQSSLIDSIINYYQEINSTDSIALAYEQVTKRYHYQLLLSLAYRDLGRYDDAINLLNGLSARYRLSEEERLQIQHLATTYNIQEWLKNNFNNWDELPEELKAPVYEFARDDRMYAGAIARTLLTEHEGRIYPPVYRMPKETLQPMSEPIVNKGNKIYPNPTDDHLFINWNGEANSVFVLIDLTGREVLHKSLKTTFTSVEISGVMPGMYLAVIKSKGKVVYQQKLVKK